MPDLESVLHAHRQAVQAFLAAAQAVPPAQWDRPRAAGKWSPGQIAEHLVLAYEASRDVLRGRASGPAAPRLLRPLLRTFLLKPVLRFRRFPSGSKSPAVLQPGSSPAAAAVLLERLRAAAAAFEGDVAADQRVTVDHPAFGRLPVADLVRLQEIHTLHHREQLSPD